MAKYILDVPEQAGEDVQGAIFCLLSKGLLSPCEESVTMASGIVAAGTVPAANTAEGGAAGRGQIRELLRQYLPGVPTAFTISQAYQYLENGLPLEKLVQALEIASGAPRPSWAYARGVINNWKSFASLESVCGLSEKKDLKIGDPRNLGGYVLTEQEKVEISGFVGDYTEEQLYEGIKRKREYERKHANDPAANYHQRFENFIPEYWRRREAKNSASIMAEINSTESEVL